MSVDKLQEKIRKLKNPSVLDLRVSAEQVPPHLFSNVSSYAAAYKSYCEALLDALKDTVPAVRFSFNSFALMGPEGLEMLPVLLEQAKAMGYYVLLDGPESFSKTAAQMASEVVLALACDGVVLSAYVGSDCLKPYVQKLKDSEKSLFMVIRTANKSASELQELMTGSRLMYMAAADVANRLGEPLVGRWGYSQIGGVGAATSADSLRALRSKYKGMFLLVDGYDYTNANAKNCSFAFDKLGHGAVVCAGRAITGAWLAEDDDGTRFVELSLQAAERMKKNLLRYITVL